MTRTTDPDDHERFQPLGSPIPKPSAPAQPEWRQKPGAAPGVQEHRDTGRLRTNIQENNKCS